MKVMRELKPPDDVPEVSPILGTFKRFVKDCCELIAPLSEERQKKFECTTSKKVHFGQLMEQICSAPVVPLVGSARRSDGRQFYHSNRRKLGGGK